MPRIYSESDTLMRIAQGLIPNHHPELASARIKYLFVDKGASKGGRELFGKAQKVSGVNEFLIEHDFLITVSEEKWRDLTAKQRHALMDHLLECCTGEEDEKSGGAMKWKIREPEVQEFASILDRHGVWHDGLTQFIQIAQAIDLDTIVQEEGEVNLAENLVNTTELN
jgi:Putative phage metallopeptidase